MANYGFFGVYNAFPQVRSNYSYGNLYKKLTDISLPKATNSYPTGVGIFGFIPAMPSFIPYSAANNTKQTTKPNIPSLNKNAYAVNNQDKKEVSKTKEPVISPLSDLKQLDETTEALKDALNNPNLTPEEKAIIQLRLDAVEIKEENTEPVKPVIPSLSDLKQLDETTEALKDALNNPNLTPEEKAIIQSRLDAVEIKEEEKEPVKPVIPSLGNVINPFSGYEQEQELKHQA